MTCVCTSLQRPTANIWARRKNFWQRSGENPSPGALRIYGSNLPETILRKVYLENAARQLKVVV